jgi:hypothetical protein
MIHLFVRRAARCTSSLTPLLIILSLFLAACIAIAATVGDQVELKATHQAGILSTKNPAARMTSSASRMARERT